MMPMRLVTAEQTLLEEIADKRMTRGDVALTYAFALYEGDDIDWPKVNQAIIDRWSLSALKYIKEAAWKRVKDKQR
jgi:hypothetical protein